MQLSRQNLTQIDKYQDFFTLRQRIAEVRPVDLAEFLLGIAIANVGDQADRVAGCLLIDLEPKCPYSCEQVLARVHKSNWNVSYKELPFYLVSQFGKWAVLREIEKFANSVSPGETLSRVEGISYWVRMPTSELAKPLHYWEWQDAIEGEHP
jgi:hypothetical protein